MLMDAIIGIWNAIAAAPHLLWWGTLATARWMLGWGALRPAIWIINLVWVSWRRDFRNGAWYRRAWLPEVRYRHVGAHRA